MHGRVMDFIRGVKVRYPRVFRTGSAVEFGAYDINGSARPLFEVDEYVAVDWRPGPGVDVVSLAHEYGGDPGHFDTALATQMLEHDPYWRETIAAMCRLVKRGGAMLLTWAGPGWSEHEVNTAPQQGYYGNLSLAEVMQEIAKHATWLVEVHEQHVDPPDVFWAGVEKQ